jgi:hypothetical protein
MNCVLRNYEIFSSGMPQQQFTLFNGEQKLLSLTYNIPLQTARLESNNTKRVLMVYNEGRRMPKTVLKNEYGFDIGILEQTLENGYGKIDIYGSKYYYQFSMQDYCIMHLYNSPGEQPLMTITFETPLAEFYSSLQQQELASHLLYCVLLSTCWYLQLPETANVLFDTSNEFLSV